MDHTERLKALAERFLKNQCTTDEVKELFSYINRNSVTDELDPLLEDIWNKLEGYPALDGSHRERLLRKIRANITREKATRKEQRWLLPLKIAAAVTLLATVIGILNFQEDDAPETNLITRTAQVGQRASYVLPDGSSVKLNTGSSITFPGNFNESVRSVKLDGEAFFEVVKNAKRPFTVESGGVKTRVLGTSFNVRAYQGQNVEVTVATGKVEVASLLPSSSGENEVVLLTPNKQAVYDPVRKSFAEATVDIRKYLAWNTTELILENSSMNDVIFMLEKRFDQKIILQNPEMGNCVIRKAKYNKESLETILKGLQLLLDFKYEFNGYNQWTLIGKGCE